MSWPNLSSTTHVILSHRHHFSNDGSVCSVDTCNKLTGQCMRAMSAECCGNGICEAGEYDTCSDCGEFQLDTPIPHTSISFACPQYRFDIEAKGEDISITGLSVHPYDSSGTVSTTMSVWTAPNGYNNNAWSPSAWTQVASSVPVSGPSKTCLVC